MSRVDPQFKLRLPQELKNYLSEQAELNRRSQTAEVIYRLEQSRKQDESQRGKQADA
ncbi:Arc family DNA-binding protein [Ectopseudomonas mendocina]|nr:Arc family DNA-binding protein [Pseudomonas mendocina]TRO14107.1 Arc family DNA-binding protein [Pseudomonas mendocina]TRO22256.1 Arc family DNA-binding protein [Pseudomonas mendocina]UZZ08945.1 Arc family DNA-binding protein [Pseudomonas mendocina]